MESFLNIGDPVAAASLGLTGLDPVLWGMAAVVSVCIGVLGFDALRSPHSPSSRPAPHSMDDRGHGASGEISEAA